MNLSKVQSSIFVSWLDYFFYQHKMSLPTLFVPGSVKSESTEDLSRVRPIDYINLFLNRTRGSTGVHNRLLVLKAETASGKSTGFLAELYKKFIGSITTERGILCTQPRTLTTIQNIIEIVSIPGYSFFKIGQNIGWSTRYNKFKPIKTGLLMATIGTLSALLLAMTDDQICAKFQFLIIDETHERDLETDFAILMLRDLLKRLERRTDCPFVVLMSATFDPLVFLNYFAEVEPRVTERQNFIWVQGRSFGVKQHWNWAGQSGMNFGALTSAAADCVRHIVFSPEGLRDVAPATDILIFMPGMKEIRETVVGVQKLGAELAKQHKQSMSVLAVDSRSQNAQTLDYRLLFSPIESHPTVNGIKPNRRVIVTTNMAETGLTLSNLKYVIDCGLARDKQYYPTSYAIGLVNVPAPKSRILQRLGRAGRKFPGEFFPLYSESTWNALPVQQLPRIFLEDCADLLLKIAVMKKGVVDFSKISMLDNPAPECITSAVESLYGLGYIKLTLPLGGGVSSIHDLAMPAKDGTSSINESLSIHELVQSSAGETRGLPSRVGAFATTELARKCALASIEHRLFRMIVGAYTWKVAPLDMITIAAYTMIEQKELAASKEPIKWIDLIKQSKILYTADDNYSAVNFYLLIADDFILGLILHHTVVELISTVGIDKTKSMLAAANISWQGVEKFIQLREEYIESIIGADIKPFTDETSLPDRQDKMAYMCRIKRCIYEAYRFFLLRWDDEHACYISPCGRKIEKPTLLRKDSWMLKQLELADISTFIHPKWVVTNQIIVAKNKKTSIYELSCDKICALDGFTAVDETFL
jgi:HrpA-like RNA helicase